MSLDDDDWVADEAAETDDGPDASAGDDDLDDADAGTAVYTAPCTGGPWSGSTVTVRFPAGFLLVHRPSRQVWIYKLDGGLFRCTPESPLALDDERRWAAAESGDYDIRVLDADLAVAGVA